MFWPLLHRFKSEWKLLAPVLAVCALGMGFGWYYYWQVGQFDPSSQRYVHWAWWPLVSDSPNAVTLFVVAAVAHMFGRRWWLLDSLAFTLNLYVGMWTTFVFLRYPEAMRTFDWAGVAEGNMNPVLFITHMGMPLLSLVLVKDLLAERANYIAIAGVLVLLAAFVGVDYWGPHLHPAPFLHDQSQGDAALHIWAPILMVVAAAAWLWVVWPRAAKQ